MTGRIVDLSTVEHNGGRSSVFKATLHFFEQVCPVSCLPKIFNLDLPDESVINYSFVPLLHRRVIISMGECPNCCVYTTLQTCQTTSRKNRPLHHIASHCVSEVPMLSPLINLLSTWVHSTQSMRQVSWIICKATSYSVNERFEGHLYFDTIFSPISWPGGCRLPTWSNLGILGLKKWPSVFCSQAKGLFPRRTPTFLLNQGCFPVGWA